MTYFIALIAPVQQTDVTTSSTTFPSTYGQLPMLCNPHRTGPKHTKPLSHKTGNSLSRSVPTSALLHNSATHGTTHSPGIPSLEHHPLMHSSSGCWPPPPKSPQALPRPPPDGPPPYPPPPPPPHHSHPCGPSAGRWSARQTQPSSCYGLFATGAQHTNTSTELRSTLAEQQLAVLWTQLGLPANAL